MEKPLARQNFMAVMYGLCFLAGGIFIFLGAAEGFDGVDFDHHVEWDLAGSEQIPPRLAPFLKFLLTWLPFLSLRFWTFGSATFGLSGLLLQTLEITQHPTQIFWISLVIGTIVGSGTAAIMRWLQTTGEADSLVRSEDLQGSSGLVTIPFDAASRGQVRVEVKGSQLHMLAMTSEERTFAKGDKVLVVGLENSVLWVVSEDYVDKL